MTKFGAAGNKMGRLMAKFAQRTPTEHPLLGWGENFKFGRKFWVRAKIAKILGSVKRECSVGVLCANFAVSLSISFSAARNLVIHHPLTSSRKLGWKDF